MRDLFSQMETAKGSAVAKNRGGATSMNTLRNLDMGTEIASNQTKNNAINQLKGNFLGAQGQLQNQETQLLSQQDQMVMQGEAQRDLADRQDLDAMYTEFGANYAGISTGVQQLGKNINEAKGRNTFLNLLPQLSSYGIGIDSNGNLYKK